MFIRYVSKGIFEMVNAPLISAIVPFTVFPEDLITNDIVAYSRGSPVDLSNTLPDIDEFIFA